MYLLAEVIPAVRRVRIPFSRDQFMLLMAAVMEIVMGVDIYLAHSITGTLKFGEWIPVFFGPMAGILLLVAGFIALRRRPLANAIGSVIFLLSIAVGLLGSYYHLHRALLPNAPAGQQLTTTLLVYGPPLLGPLTFVLVAVLGLSAAWQEDPAESGRLRLFGNIKISMPLAKTRAYFFMVALFILVTLLSSVLDHARTNFANPWLWFPTITGTFAVLVTTAMGAYDRLDRRDLITFIVSMLALVLVGLVGALLHVERNLSGQGSIIDERFIHGAPLLAPLLYANMAALGLIVLLPAEVEENKANPAPDPD